MMFRLVDRWKILFLTVALGGWGLGVGIAPVQAAERPSATSLAALPDGDYQWCTQPPPQDWRDGAGVCLRFLKRSDQVQGYYGYPHSDRFICLQGQVKGDRVRGRAMDVVWEGYDWSAIPSQPVTWDEEGHLTIAQGKRLPVQGDRSDEISWVIFEEATLDVTGFYAYSTAKMTPVPNLCRPWVTFK